MPLNACIIIILAYFSSRGQLGARRGCILCCPCGYHSPSSK